LVQLLSSFDYPVGNDLFLHGPAAMSFVLETPTKVKEEVSLYNKFAVPMDSKQDFQQFLFEMSPTKDNNNQIEPPESTCTALFEHNMKPLIENSNLSEFVADHHSEAFFHAISPNEEDDGDSQFGSGNTSRTSALFQVSGMDQINLNEGEDTDEGESMSYSHVLEGSSYHSESTDKGLSKRYDSPCSLDDEVSSIFTDGGHHNQCNVHVEASKSGLEDNSDLWDVEDATASAGETHFHF
jgi:hypothetical protein